MLVFFYRAEGAPLVETLWSQGPFQEQPPQCWWKPQVAFLILLGDEVILRLAQGKYLHMSISLAFRRQWKDVMCLYTPLQYVSYVYISRAELFWVILRQRKQTCVQKAGVNDDICSSQTELVAKAVEKRQRCVRLAGSCPTVVFFQFSVEWHVRTPPSQPPPALLPSINKRPFHPSVYLMNDLKNYRVTPEFVGCGEIANLLFSTNSGHILPSFTLQWRPAKSLNIHELTYSKTHHGSRNS